MKGKNVFFALGLSLVMGLGAIAALGATRKADQVKADAVTTLYLDINHLSWYGDQSRAYLYGGTGSPNNTWPGQPLTHVNGTLYKLDVANIAQYDKAIFLRSNGTDVWNRTSKDGGTAINLPSDWSVANKFTFKSDWDGNTEYDDGNYTGNWGLYTPPAVTYTVQIYVDDEKQENQTVGEGELPDAPAGKYGKEFSGWFDNAECSEGHEVTAINSDTTVYGKFVALPTVRYFVDFSQGEIGTFDTKNFYAFEDGGRQNADWPGEAIGGFPLQFTVPNDAEIVINAGKDKEQTVNITQTGIADDTLYILSSKTDGKYNVLWESQKDEPESNETYYLVGSETNWKYKNAPQMDTTSKYKEDNTAVLFDYEAKAGEEVQARGVFSGVDKWYGITGEGGDNLVFESAGHYDIYLNASKQLSAAPAVARHDAIIVCYKYAGSSLETTEVKNEIIYENVAYVPQASIDGYICRGFFTSSTFDVEYVPQTLNTDKYLYAKFTKSCYYLVGDDAFMGAGHGWNVDYATAVAAGTGSNRLVGAVTIPEGADEEHPVAVKPLLYTLVTDGVEDPNGEPGFKAEYYTLGEERTFVSIDGSGNFAFTEPGTYAFYINNSNAVYFNIGEYAFHAKFLSEVGSVCAGIEGETKTIEELQTVWANQKAAYNSLSAEDKQNIIDVGFDGGDAESSDERLQMVAKYHRIVTKYGTALFEDFIWNNTISSNKIRMFNANSNATLIVVLASMVTIVGIASILFVIRRRKEAK